MTSRRARRGAAILALCLGPLTASGCTAATGRVQKAASPATKHVASAPVVMFLGDSYTVGERGALPETTYASAVARLLGWQVVVAGKAGTGFVNGGVRRSAYIQLFESQLGWRPAPDLLVVSGGHNDHRYPPDQVTGAARIVLERARQRWPRTRLALIGPIWGNETPPRRSSRSATGCGRWPRSSARRSSTRWASGGSLAAAPRARAPRRGTSSGTGRTRPPRATATWRPCWPPTSAGWAWRVPPAPGRRARPSGSRPPRRRGGRG
ncbi:SGNH/GDSL hydrolase family protein [Actinomadura sp. J1-007]|uniref:SGNH/GDSL hydrolase family protein n=1 Tax=Actinomadura sp. J1-007 TaxID=2661913 RepID=UPI001F4F2D68|nr:SGNH/GDSL hydrolase family protein [Actinomadura sp. J1-007]